MKKIFLGLILLLLSNLAYGKMEILENSIIVNQEFKYDVYYKIGGLKIGKIATAVAQVRELFKEDSLAGYQTILIIESTSTLGRFYNFRWEFHSYVTKDEFISLKFRKWINSKGEETHMMIDFDQENHQAIYLSDTMITVVGPLGPEARDFLAIIQAIINLDYSQLQRDDLLKTSSLEEDWKRPCTYLVKITKVEKEKIKIGGAEFNCYRAEGLCWDEKTEEKSPAKIWVTSFNGKNLLVKFELMKFEYGSLVLEINTED